MRTLIWFIKFFIGLGVFMAVVALIGREVLLFTSIAQLEGDIRRLQNLGTQSVSYSSKCGEKAGRLNSGVEYIQLRFLTSTSYNLEVVCQFAESDPIVVERRNLFPMVNKIPGESGVIWDPEGKSGFAIEVLGRSATFILDGEEIRTSQGKREIQGNQPKNYCQGFGYQCCDSVTEIGTGGKFTQVLDCYDQCYEQCLPRPVVLRFSSDPNPDPKTKIVQLAANDQVTFFYSIDPGKSQSTQVTVEFGDGQQEILSDVEGLVPHMYACGEAECVYIATVSAVDEDGQPSSVTAVSTLEVRVKGR